MKVFVARLLKKHRGATLIDYAILLGCIAIVAIGVTRALGEKIENIFGNISNSFDFVDKTGERCEYCWGALPVPDDEKEKPLNVEVLLSPASLFPMLLFPLYPLIGCEEAVAYSAYWTCPTCHRKWSRGSPPPPPESPAYRELFEMKESR